MTILRPLTKSLLNPLTQSIIDDGGITPPVTIDFISTWQTDNAGISASDQITLPLQSNGVYNFNVDWGDGSNDNITAWDQAEVTHTYPSAGSYLVIISGQIQGFRFFFAGDKDKITDISSWGVLNLGNDGAAFAGCSNLTITATDIIDLTGVTNLINLFVDCVSITTIPNIGLWDVSGVTVLASAFKRIPAFNDDISLWNTANVISFAFLFEETAFNQDITLWNTSSLGNLRGTFKNNTAFNQNISAWDISGVNDTTSMCEGALAFDQNLAAWDVTTLAFAGSMFNSSGISDENYSNLLIGWDAQVLQPNVFFGANSSRYSVAAEPARSNMISSDSWTIDDLGQIPSFISTWQTNNSGTSASDQITLPLHSGGVYNFNVDWGDGSNDNITAWNQSEVTHTYPSSGNYQVVIIGQIQGWIFSNGGDKLKILNISEVGPLLIGFASFGAHFYGCSNLTITATAPFDLTGVIRFDRAFKNCFSITTAPAIGLMDTSNVTNLFETFNNCLDFVEELAGWDTGNVTSFERTFGGATSFNSNIGSWDVSSGQNFSSMFNSLPLFDQDLGGWDVSNMTSANFMFTGASLSTANYDSLLVGWDARSLKTNVVFNAGFNLYSAGAPAIARANMISSDLWIIIDGGPA